MASNHVSTLLALTALMCLSQAEAGSLSKVLSASDWRGIRAGYDQHRHAAYPVSGGHQARNPGQQWVTRFDGRGFEVTPAAGDWTWGLELRSYGRADGARAMAGPPRVTASGQRVSYQWDAALTEWYVNDARGLEHGFTLSQRPSGGGRLQFQLAVRGGLRPDGGGAQVRFHDPAGRGVLRYGGLKVWDADGKTLAARMVPSAAGLLLEVEESGARYPITIDPLAQQTILRASPGDAGDIFGTSVAVSGNTVVIGAPGEDSSATGVNGNQTGNSALDSGAAYVFVSNGGVWSMQAYLKASNTGAGDTFGRSVAISGDTIVVGAIGESGAAGAAYVFVRNGAVWTQQAYLKASNAGGGDRFGISVALDGQTAVVGALQEASSATGVNGTQSNNSAPSAGAAYVFVRTGGAWSQQAYLKASNAEAFDEFGTAVAISGDTVVVSAPLEGGSATGVNGANNNNAFAAGAAYVFVRNAGVWSQQAYLKASNTGDGDVFGSSGAVSGDTILIGAFGESSSATGVNGNQSNNSAATAGAAYVFVRNSGVWTQQAYLKASNTGAGDRFGVSVALDGDTAAVGAYQEGSGTGSQSDNSAANSGAVYLFGRAAGAWTQQEYVKASNIGGEDLFGEAIAMSGGTLVVGARLEDGETNTVESSGAAYVFATPAPSGLRFVPIAPCRVADTRAGQGTTGNFGPPTLEANTSRELPLPAGRCGIPATAQAYSLNVTAVPHEPLGFLSLWPTGQAQPLVSTLNSFHAGVVANAAIVPAGVNGGINVFVTNRADVIVDINGYFESASGFAFYTVNPCRLADTRAGGGFAGAFGPPTPAANSTRTFPLPSGSCSLPAGAAAYSLNFTVVPATTLGFLTAWPTGQAQPFVSTLNSFDGAVVANAAIVPAGTNGSVNTFVTDAADQIIDTNGYFGAAGGLGALTFFPVTPCRVADTRSAGNGAPVMAGNETRNFTLAGKCGVPAGARAYAMNVTVVPKGALGFLTLWPAGGTQPFVSTLNSFLGRVVANAAIVPAGTGGAVSVFVTNETEVILDVNGYFQ